MDLSVQKCALDTLGVPVNFSVQKCALDTLGLPVINYDDV